MKRSIPKKQEPICTIPQMKSVRPRHAQDARAHAQDAGQHASCGAAIAQRNASDGVPWLVQILHAHSNLQALKQGDYILLQGVV